MSSPKRITIVGGGLAGLTLGIGLRMRGVAVSVIEAGHYPRHRVCGEFISGRGQEVLERLGLRALLIKAGAIPARTARFCLGGISSPRRLLPKPALCVSRFVLDELLARQFETIGGDLREGQRDRQEDLPEGTVRASGRRLQVQEGGWRWFGLKVHARVPLSADREMRLRPALPHGRGSDNEALPHGRGPDAEVPLIADLEMHGSHSGYVGISRLPEGESNICGLFRAKVGQPRKRSGLARKRSGLPPAAVPVLPHQLQPDVSDQVPEAPAGWKAALHSLLGACQPPLRQLLAEARFDPASFCSVAGLSLRPRRARASSECCIGDALTMTPPVTGNGMSMAFESAEIAIEPLAAYSRGQMSWARARQEIASQCDAAFAGRLAWAKCLQRLMFWLPDWPGLAQAVLDSNLVWRWLFERTR